MNYTTTDSKTINSFLDPSEKLIRGKSIRVSIAEMPPYLYIEKDSRGNVVNISGYLADLWNILEGELHFRSVYLDSGPAFLGNNENGTWNGMVGDLQSKRADVGLTTFGITKERKRVIDFSAAVDFESSKFLMFSNSNTQLVDWKTFLTTLSWEIWCCTAMIWILTALILTYVSRPESNATHFNYLFYLLGAIASQGSEVSPQRIQGRIIFITFWFMCVVLNASFTALLTTNLTTATYKPLPSLDEALDKGFRVSVLKGTQQHQAIIESTNPTTMRIANMIKQDKSLLVPSDEEGVASTLDGKTLFVFDSTILIYLTSSNCSFKLQPPILLQGFMHLGFRKDFEYREPLNRRILRMLSTGVIKKLAIKWLYPSFNCEAPREEVPSLGLRKTLFAFALISLGVIFSFVLLLIECAVHSYQKKKNSKERDKTFEKYTNCETDIMDPNSNI